MPKNESVRTPESGMRRPECDIGCALRQFSDAGFSPYQSARLNGYDAVSCAYQPLVWRLFVRMVGIRPRGKQ